MEIKISTRHGQLGQDTQQFIREKVEKLLRIFERLTSIDVTVDLSDQEGRYGVEILAKAEHKHDFIARERNTDILAGVDLVLNKVEQQLRKHKEKLQDRRRTPAMGEVKPSPSEPEEGEE